MVADIHCCILNFKVALTLLTVRKFYKCMRDTLLYNFDVGDFPAPISPRAKWSKRRPFEDDKICLSLRKIMTNIASAKLSF